MNYYCKASYPRKNRNFQSGALHNSWTLLLSANPMDNFRQLSAKGPGRSAAPAMAALILAGAT